MAEDIKKKIGIQRKRSFLARDFQDFRADLLEHARSHFSDKIQDFSEASMGGLFLDMAAYVGDNMSFYLDHQFRELNPETAVESKNIESMIRNAGLKISGNSPASAMVEIYIEVEKTVSNTGEVIPMHSYLPIIKENSIFKSKSGISFYLSEDIDFSIKDDNGSYDAEVTPILNNSGTIESFVFMKKASCVSGNIATENFDIGNNFVPYRTITLSNSHVSTILSVIDADGNEYFEVESLSQDTVFRKNQLSNGTSSIDVVPAPYRFISKVDITTRSTIIQFGSGDQTDEVNISDPSQMSIPLYGKKSFSSFSLDPNKLLSNKSLGISPTNTTISVVYRYGGGSSHNVPNDTITEVATVDWVFPPNIPYESARSIRNSISVNNPSDASGGAMAPTLFELKNFVTSARTMQNRIVTKEDLLARIYTLPTEFGVVYRANTVPNPDNALSSLLYIVSRDKEGKLTTCSDSLKRNLSTYLNEFRLIGDAMDILDGKIINFQIKLVCKFHPSVNKFELISKIISEVKNLFLQENVNLGKEINATEIIATVANIPGVQSVEKPIISNIIGEHDSFVYSSSRKNMNIIEKNSIYSPEPYEIFELKYPNRDIIVNVV